MNFHWLVFHYDFNKLSQLRKDFDNHNAVITFDYTCASLKTFIDHNRKRESEVKIWTDDVPLMNRKLKQYSLPSFCVMDIKEEILEDKRHPYPWKVKSAFLERHLDDTGFFIDNDCICKRPVDDLIARIDDKSIILWEFEKRLSESRPYWGWQMAANHLKKPLTYWIANDGIIGLSKHVLTDMSIMNRSTKICEEIYYNVDVSTQFPDRHPKIMIAQQMALCFAAQDLGLDLIESKDYFDHHYTDKKKCLQFLPSCDTV